MEETNEETKEVTIEETMGETSDQTKVQTKKKAHKCEECELSFNRRDHLVRHSLVHTKLKSFECLYCPKEFTRSDHLRRHCEKIHGKAKLAKLKRKQKPKNAGTSSENTHNKSGKERPECQLCNKTFSKKVHLTRHINNIHVGIDNTSFDFDPEQSPKKQPIVPPMPRSYDCNMCGKRFSFPAFLKRHHDDVHSIDGHIEILNKLNPNNSIVSQLEKTPSGFDPLFSVPDFEFIQAQPISEPVKVRRPPQSYDCSICSSKFKRSDHLARHLRNVHGKTKKHSKADATENSQSEKEFETVDVKVELEGHPKLEEVPNGGAMDTHEVFENCEAEASGKALDPELESAGEAEVETSVPVIKKIPEIVMETSDSQLDP